MYPQYPAQGSRRCFNGMVTAMDEAVGAIVGELKSSQLYGNSIIVYSSDNGGPAQRSNNLPLRGAKFGAFEGSSRVPALVHSPLLPSAVVGKISEQTIYIADWYVTFAKLAGVAPSLLSESGPVPPDGIDIWSTLLGAGGSPPSSSPRSFIVHEYDTVQVGRSAGRPYQPAHTHPPPVRGLPCVRMPDG